MEVDEKKFINRNETRLLLYVGPAKNVEQGFYYLAKGEVIKYIITLVISFSSLQ